MHISLKCLSLQDLNEGLEEQKEEILRKLSSHLLSIAKRHECYRVLWRICCDLNDSVLLRNLMVWIWLFYSFFFFFSFPFCMQNCRFAAECR